MLYELLNFSQCSGVISMLNSIELSDLGSLCSELRLSKYDSRQHSMQSMAVTM